jgi:hypothetical protein
MLSLETLAAVAVVLIQTVTPVWYPTEGKFINPETKEARTERLTMIAEVNAEAAYGQKGKNETPWGARDDLALLKAIMGGESAYEYRVHAGQKSHIGTADAGNALCMGQIHFVRAWWTEAEWRALAGLDRVATKRCSEAILRVLAYHAKRCRLRSDVSVKKRWATPLNFTEGRRLIRWYGNGNCGNRMTKTMSAKALAFLRIQRKIYVGVSRPAAAPKPKDRAVSYTIEKK